MYTKQGVNERSFNQQLLEKRVERGATPTMIGQSGASSSYSVRASVMLQAWNVTCRQLQPIPKPIQSM